MSEPYHPNGHQGWELNHQIQPTSYQQPTAGGSGPAAPPAPPATPSTPTDDVDEWGYTDEDYENMTDEDFVQVIDENTVYHRGVQVSIEMPDGASAPEQAVIRVITESSEVIDTPATDEILHLFIAFYKARLDARRGGQFRMPGTP